MSPGGVSIAVGVLVNLIVLAFVLGKFSERLDFLKGEVIQLQNDGQTPAEREALTKLLEAKFEAHEELDDLRFKALTDALANRLDRILEAVNGRART